MTFKPVDTGNPDLNREINMILAMADPTPPAWWWLSFVDESRPKGDRFVGACMVKASNGGTAMRRAWALGINPGGQVGIMGPFTDDQLPPGQPVDVLMSRAEIEAL